MDAILFVGTELEADADWWAFEPRYARPLCLIGILSLHRLYFIPSPVIHTWRDVLEARLTGRALPCQITV